MFKLVFVCLALAVSQVAASCSATSSLSNDAWCDSTCSAPEPFCPCNLCDCGDCGAGDILSCSGVVPLFDDWCNAVCNYNLDACSSTLCDCTGSSDTFYCDALDVLVTDDWCVARCGLNMDACPSSMCDCYWDKKKRTAK